MKKIKTDCCFTSGVALAPAVVLQEQDCAASHSPAKEKEAELARFRQAREVVVVELGVLAETNEIFAAHLELVQDPTIEQEVTDAIFNDGKNAEWAVEDVISAYAAIFEQMDDEYMCARAADIRDIGKRLLLKLKGGQDDRLFGITSHCILVARDLAPSDTAKMNPQYVDGFLTEEGGVTSHVAIMAKNLGIPALVGVRGILDAAETGIPIAMDAANGEIIVAPDEKETARYYSLLEQQRQQRERMAAAVELPSKTVDGRKLRLYANVGSLPEIEAALACGASGVGLFRTEFLYMENSHFPTEEEQYEVYAAAARRMGERELIIRTLDIGGDKHLPYYAFEQEDNPFLGYRAIRFCLGNMDLFKTQLRALLRASAVGNLCIMFPMLVSLTELQEATSLLERCKAELRSEGQLFNEKIKVGMMIETPASVLLADRFSTRVDFFSIGTNDLTQYILAADRGNRKLSSLYDAFHPAVLHAIQAVITAGHRAGIPVGMCGEFAGDPVAFPLLLGMGLDEFSVSARRIPELKQRLQKTSEAEARKLAERVLTCDTAVEAKRLSGNAL